MTKRPETYARRSKRVFEYSSCHSVRIQKYAKPKKAAKGRCSKCGREF